MPGDYVDPREIAGWRLPGGIRAFCLERWQSLHETRARVVLSESGVEPPSTEWLLEHGVLPSSPGEWPDLGYGHTRGDPRLREAIAGLYGVGPENIVVSAGTTDAALAVMLALVAPGDTVIVDEPNYPHYALVLERLGARIVAWRRRAPDWSLRPRDLAEAILEHKPKAVFITNPNNPTGRVERSLAPVAEAAAETRAVLVFDEVYRGLELEGPEAPSVLVAALEHGAEAVALGGLSKAYGLPGLRISWAAASTRRLAALIWAGRDYTTISPPRLSEAVAARALAPGARRALLERARGIVSRNLRLLEEALGGWIAVRPEAGAFALLRSPSGDSLRDAWLLLRGHDVLVVPGDCMGAPGLLRVALGVESEEAAAEAYAALARALDSI